MSVLLKSSRMLLSVTSWMKRKSGLVGRLGTTSLLGVVIVTLVLYFFQDIPYEVSIKRRDVTLQMKADKHDGNVIMYEYEFPGNSHLRKLKRSASERGKETEKEKHRTGRRKRKRDHVEKRREREEEEEDNDGEMYYPPSGKNLKIEFQDRVNFGQLFEDESKGEDVEERKEEEAEEKEEEEEIERIVEEEELNDEENDEAEADDNVVDDTDATSRDPAVAYPITTGGRVKRFPQTLIFGVKKCGTETLAHFMTVHPDIHYTKKEIHFFDHTKAYKRGVQWYLSKMPPTELGEITVEKTPNYFEKNVGPKRVHTFNSSIKLIAIVRDPVKRLISDYTHNKQHPGSYGRTEAYHTFSEMVFHKNGSINTNYLPIRRGIYHIHYSNWLRHFPRNQILVLDGEAFMKNPYPTLKKVETFLGLKPYIKPEHFVFSHKKHFFCKRKYNVTVCMSSNKGRKHPNVSEAVITKLQDFYRPHNSIFENMLNYKFSWP